MCTLHIFTSQLEKAREAPDASNIRVAYAGVAASALTDSEKDVTASVTLKQQVADWQNTDIKDIACLEVSNTNIPATKGGTVEIKYVGSTGKLTIAGKDVTTSFITTP